MIDPETLEVLLFLLLLLIGFYTCLSWLISLILSLLRSLHRWLFVPKSERVLDDFISLMNQASDDYVASLRKHRR